MKYSIYLIAIISFAVVVVLLIPKEKKETVIEKAVAVVIKTQEGISIEDINSIQIDTATTVIKMGKLENIKVGDLFSFYLFGYDDSKKVEREEKINFAENLKKAWLAKKGMNLDKNKTIREAAFQKIRDYDQLKGNYSKTTMVQYEKKIAKIISQLNRDMDWECFQERGSRKKLTDSELEMVINVAKKITAKEILAYSMTELMPGLNSEVSYEIYDFLLRNAGEEYVVSIPAVFDDKTSFGPYQFTSYAVFDMGEVKEGASYPNKCLKGKKIPGSVVKLSIDDHHKAAWLFAVFNLAEGIRKIPSKHSKKINELFSDKKELVKYIAIAHNLPEKAFGRLERIATTKQTGFFGVLSKKEKSYKYAKKTEVNYKYLTKLR